MPRRGMSLFLSVALQGEAEWGQHAVPPVIPLQGGASEGHSDPPAPSSPAQLTMATSPALHGCSQGADGVCQGAGFLQSVFDLHHLLPSDQGIPADVWRRQFRGTRVTPGSLFATLPFRPNISILVPLPGY